MKITNLATATTAALIALGGVVGCSSSDGSASDKPTTPAVAPTLDRDAALQESWQSAVDTYSADLKLSICEAADKGGAKSVKAFLVDQDEMPFVVEHPDYDARQWVKYCAK